MSQFEASTTLRFNSKMSKICFIIMTINYSVLFVTECENKIKIKKSLSQSTSQSHHHRDEVGPSPIEAVTQICPSQCVLPLNNN